MKKIILMMVLVMLLSACANSVKTNENESTTTTESVISNEEIAETEDETSAEKSGTNVIESVNKMNDINANFNPSVDFTYIGDDKIVKAVTDEMVQDAKLHFDTTGVIEIPSPYIVKTVDDDKNDIKVYGDFLVDGYRMDGTVFYTENGGSFPGCYHLKEDEDGNIVFVSKEIAEDGSNFEPSLKKICGGDEELYNKILNRDQYVVEALRSLYASMYANANGLKLSGIKDYGWPIILFNNISDAEFLYNFYLSYFGEVAEDDVLNDLSNRLQNLKAKYFVESLREKVEKMTEELGADYVINAQDVTLDMVNSLQVDDYGDGNLKVRYSSSVAKLTEINVKVEHHDGAIVITDISME